MILQAVEDSRQPLFVPRETFAAGKSKFVRKLPI